MRGGVANERADEHVEQQRVAVGLLAQQHPVRHREADPDERQGADRHRRQRLLGPSRENEGESDDREPCGDRGERSSAATRERRERNGGDGGVSRPGGGRAAAGELVQLAQRQCGEEGERQRQGEAPHEHDRHGRRGGRQPHDNTRAEVVGHRRHSSLRRLASPFPIRSLG